MVYGDRKDAGKRLAENLMHYRDEADVIVLGLPRGGVTVAYEVARALQCPLDILIVRKIGFPGKRRRLHGGSPSTGEGKGVPSLAEKTVILVDDGIATGATVKAAISTLKKERITKLVVALPVASQEAEREIAPMVDEWVCLQAPAAFRAVGNYYSDFTQVEDEEVVAMLKQTTRGRQ
jgi:putative phosphoribosyl transferase